jgi:hypothetical protein
MNITSARGTLHYHKTRIPCGDQLVITELYMPLTRNEYEVTRLKISYCPFLNKNAVTIRKILIYGTRCQIFVTVTVWSWVNSVQCLTTNWTPGVRSPAEAKGFSSSLRVQTSSEAHPAYPMGTGGPFPVVKRGRGVRLTTHPHLVPRSGVSRIYTSSSPWRLHVVAGQLLLGFYSVRELDIFVITMVVLKI